MMGAAIAGGVSWSSAFDDRGIIGHLHINRADASALHATMARGPRGVAPTAAPVHDLDTETARQ